MTTTIHKRIAGLLRRTANRIDPASPSNGYARKGDGSTWPAGVRAFGNVSLTPIGRVLAEGVGPTTDWDAEPDDRSTWHREPADGEAWTPITEGPWIGHWPPKTPLPRWDCAALPSRATAERLRSIAAKRPGQQIVVQPDTNATRTGRWRARVGDIGVSNSLSPDDAVWRLHDRVLREPV